ncbi:hypothetical protein SAMN05720761_101105 [Fibrobacter sp. UWCM]|uniref:DUF1302 family protein n=1 Tax=Fibrobacter sp. UWCM TaxID=1896208 RepID=UPI000923B22C|nr:DUF1302 family protein [Fibrobacter sp. UWCM]SHG30041.1 hypothetical protein SAMN05720761_101105 [Fibrobacter sp. UWCM]
MASGWWLVVGAAAVAAFAQESPFQFNGFVDTYHAVQTEWPHDFTTSRTRLRAELRVDYESAYLFASLNGIHNSILDDRTGVQLQEAYFNYSNSFLEIRAGRQIVVWGVADGLRVTDLISPVDYTEFMSSDYDDMRMAVDGIRIKYPGERVNAELVYVPVSRYFQMPIGEDNPWRPDLPENASFDFPEGPEPRLKNGDFGTRVSFFLSNLDFSISALHTHNQSPVTVAGYDPVKDSIIIHGIHETMTMFGGDMSIPLGEFVLRLEIAEYLDEALGYANNLDYARKNTFNALGGIDWYAGDNWTFMVQYLHKYIADYSDELAAEKYSSQVTFRISKELLNNTLKLALYGMFDIDNLGYYARVSGDYALSDQVTLSLGYDHFGGKRGQLAGYDKNRQVWAKAKYYF